MGKPNFQGVIISRVTNVAPDLRYIAYYAAEDTRTNACMNGYADRAFVYILTITYNGNEQFLYVEKSKAQYSRFISHLQNYAFDYIYLFECEPEHLTKSETAVIRELRPLLNQNHNPDAKHNKQFLGIQVGQPQNLETIQCYLQRREQYAPSGLYGFSLPPAVFSVLEKHAVKAGYTCSEVIQQMLEQAFSQEIAETLAQPQDVLLHTNLITIKAFGVLHKRSREQIEQHVKNNRMQGPVKVGRDWVLPNDTKFPADMRRKLPK